METEQKNKRGIAFAILAAALYAINAPFSKMLLEFMPPTLMAGFLYVGAGIGMIFIALMVFKEKISTRLWFGIFFVTLSCGILSFEDISSLRFSYGSLFVLLATICWGFENNCTRKISSKDPLQIVLLKGIFSGIGSLIIGLFIGERIEALWSIVAVLCVGFVAYGLSIYFYVYAQRLLGAARTSAYYAVAPFIAAILSLIIFREIPDVTYFVALVLMIVGAWLSSQDKPLIRKVKNE